MEKQIIISISREYGSGGHEIGRKLAEKLSLPFYDRNLLDELANNNKINMKDLLENDEKSDGFFFGKDRASSVSQTVAELQFGLLKQKARKGNSFVVIGRCSDELFDSMKNVNVLKVFICADWDEKVNRVIQKRSMDKNLAEKTILKHDKNRITYHDNFCVHRWGDARSYDLSVNSSRLGLDGTVNFIYDYVRSF